MIDRSVIQNQLAFCIENTHFDSLGSRYQGKVRDSYVKGKTRVLITSDRLSCFDVVVTSVPFKGQCLNQLAVHWFKEVEDICENHLISVPHPNVMIAEEVDILPIEVVVRDYLAGSAWRDYQAGKAVSGIEFPKGLSEFAKLPETVLTPSTKAEQGEHDLPISEAEIIERQIVSPLVWEQVREVALALFARGRAISAERGLLLVDTKYEFGLKDGKIVLADEIHTLDSSRFWIEDSYVDRVQKGEAPEMLDKEPMRQWLIEHGFQGEGEIPVISDEKRIELSEHYIRSFELVSGGEFIPQSGDALQRIEEILKNPDIKASMASGC